MREAYCEESASCQKSVREAKIYTVFKAAAVIAFAVAVVLLFFSFTLIPILVDGTVNKDTGEVYTVARVFSIVAYFSVLLLFAGGGVLCWFLKNRFNVSFDYIFVEDELRVSKVFNGKKRKHLMTFRCDQILKIGKCENLSFERTCAGLGRKQIVFLTPNREPSENKNFYYILYSGSAGKTVNILEARTELIDYLIRAAGRNKWDPQ